ncbi:MAG: single-stranded-DNA-specific exonuclease RecJ [bacterium]
MRIARRQRQCRLQDADDNDAELPPLLRRIYENRNVRTRGELDYSLKHLHPPARLKGIAEASALLQHALDAEQRILIIGDYDADGATATAVALLGLRALGARRVEYLVPNRFEYGYGLSARIAEVALAKRPQLVITVDNGISSIDGVAVLRAGGVAVIVTDHHLAGEQLPAANAIVNPNQPGCDFPSKGLAGVGVMFYLLLATRARLRESGWFSRTGDAAPNLAELLDLVALGTVADMVPLDHNNRILVAQGIARTRAGECRPGIEALLQVAGRARARLVASDFGFVVAPRINAAGRLDDISTGIECLLAPDRAQADEHARRLDEMNAQRRRIEQSMQQQALEIVARIEQSNDDAERRGWCLFDPAWHQGVVGRVASRIAETSGQPAIAFAPARDGMLSGSARSVEGLHIRDLLESISMRHPDLIERFGGHAMAAGLTLAQARLSTFAEAFAERVGAHFAEHPPGAQILTDGELAAEEFTLEMAELMRTAAPWGQRFPAPLFDGAFRVTAQRVVGERHLKMKLAQLDGARSFDAIAFGQVEPGDDAAPLDAVRAAYQLEANEYRGRVSLQLLVKHLEPCAADERHASDAT